MTEALQLAELGRRLAACRLDRDLSQEQLAEEAGVSRATLQRLEAGRSTQLGNLVRVLIALDLPPLFELVPDPAVRPLQELERQQRGRRQRASGTRVAEDESDDWSWGPDA